MRINETVNLETRDSINKEDTIKKLSREIESLFIYELLKVMRRTVSSEQGLQMDTYTSIFDLELSRVLAERGIGLGELIARQLLKNSYKPMEPDNPVVSGENRLLYTSPASGHLSSEFGIRLHPVTGKWSFHRGIDISAPPDSPVRAVRDGRVIFSGWKEGFGNIVEIDHGDGTITRYGHNSRNLVSTGDEVKRGTPIALVGNTGLSTGPHLHFEVIVDGKPVDPQRILPELKS